MARDFAERPARLGKASGAEGPLAISVRKAALAAARAIVADPDTTTWAAAVTIELHVREVLEHAIEVATLWAVVRGTPEGRMAAEDLARELRVVMEVA